MFDYKSFLKNLTHRPGVYQMLNQAGDVIYVGKAKNLKNRVSSYFRANSSLASKTQVMVAQIHQINITVTHTEAEALLLESNLIKKLRPKYNILLKDDKSYPYIRVSSAEYPRISFYRGNRKKDAEYFGPYPNSSAVKESLNLLQKLFKVRQCEDSYFANRSRPCLQYQIKRCSAPCVGLVTEAEYQRDLDNTRLFLKGKSQQVVSNLVERMDEAASRLAYEEAARLRDQIQEVQQVAERQYISLSGDSDVDVLAIDSDGGITGVHVHYIRGGQSLGGKSLFPKVPKGETKSDVLSAFIVQYYLRNPLPNELILSLEIENKETLIDALKLHHEKNVKITWRPRGDRSQWLKLAKMNVQNAIAARIASREGIGMRLENLRQVLDLEEVPARMECFDISHTSGEATVASCVVFDREGANKSLYRRFNIKDITPGDDYAAMYQALHRRYARVQKEQGIYPDVLFIDGGKGQVKQAETVLAELNITQIMVVGVAKGPERIAGEETLILPATGQEMNLPDHSPALHIIQQIRDEAHRFAITGHRNRRAKARKKSMLDNIPGVGAKRRQELIKRFGGIQGIMRAGVNDLEQVPGISHQLAQLIYDSLNSD